MFIKSCEGKQSRHVICHQHNCKRKFIFSPTNHPRNHEKNKENHLDMFIKVFKRKP